MTTVDGNSIAWTKAVSTKGKIFEVGVKKSKGDRDDGASASTLLLHVISFWIPAERLVGPIQSVMVDWETNTSGNPTASVQEKTGIVFYSLQDNNPSAYDWRLDITTNRKYDYYFVDAEGDKYEINVYEAGSHYVRYNSNNPTIVKIFYS